MTAITLETLRDRIRRIGDYENSAVFTNAFLNEQINDAIGEYCDMLDETWEGYRDLTSANIPTVAGTATVAMPAGLLRLRAFDIQLNGSWYPLTRLTIKQTYGYDSSKGQPIGYMAQGATIELFPTPDAVYQTRVRYVPAATVLALDADTFDFPNGWEKFVIYTVLAVLDDREERDNRGRLAVAAQIRDRVRAAAGERQSAEPEYVPLPGEIGFDWR